MALYKWSKYSIQWVESSSQVTNPPITFNSVYWYSEGKPSFDASGSYTLPTSHPLPSSTTSQGVSGRYVSNAQITSEIYYGQSSVFINGNTKRLEGRFEKYTTSPTKGAFIGFVYSTDQSAYPNDGISDGYYYDQREIVVPSPPVALNVPDIAMQGNQITVSWSAVSIADSYILERKANTDSDWTQVYSGANLSFSETVGTWTSVQYRVKAGVSGTYGDYTTSASVPVVSASIVVISGTDGDLGTLTSDVSYTVSSSGTTALTVVETINGIARTFTAVNGATNKISVVDLPTGTGTITITASTNPGAGVVTVKRSWTYTKEAITFPDAGSVAQLTQQGNTIWAKTIAEAIRTPGIWGGNLGLALQKLAKAMLFDPDSGAVEDISGGAIPMVSIETGSYVGTGTFGSSHPNSISLNFKPDFAVIVGNNVIAVFQSELTSTYRSGGGMTALTEGELYARFLNGTLSWYTTDTSYDRTRMQCNMQNSRYYYYAIRTTGGAA